MRQFRRGPVPTCLESRASAWAERWADRKQKDTAAAFFWPKVDGIPLNQILVGPPENPGPLKAQTDSHCSYCDLFPVSPPGEDTIDHFHPKSDFPELAYHWDNLYYACTHCQRRGSDWESNLLRPDADDFTFDQYFIWDFTTGEILPNPGASVENQDRAKRTIALFQLNRGHPNLRKRELKRLRTSGCTDLTDFAYRHFLG